MPRTSGPTSLAVEHQAVPVALDVVVAAPEPDEAVLGLLLVGDQRLGRVDRATHPSLALGAGSVIHCTASPGNPVRSTSASSDLGGNGPAVVRAAVGVPLADGVVQRARRRRRRWTARRAPPGCRRRRRGAASPSAAGPWPGSPAPGSPPRSPGRRTVRARAGRPCRCCGTVSTKTSIGVGADAEDPRLGVVRARGQDRRRHRAERTRGVPPLPPRFVGRRRCPGRAPRCRRPGSSARRSPATTTVAAPRPKALSTLRRDQPAGGESRLRRRSMSDRSGCASSWSRRSVRDARGPARAVGRAVHVAVSVQAERGGAAAPRRTLPPGVCPGRVRLTPGVSGPGCCADTRVDRHGCQVDRVSVRYG